MNMPDSISNVLVPDAGLAMLKLHLGHVEMWTRVHPGIGGEQAAEIIRAAVALRRERLLHAPGDRSR